MLDFFKGLLKETKPEQDAATESEISLEPLQVETLNFAKISNTEIAVELVEQSVLIPDEYFLLYAISYLHFDGALFLHPEHLKSLHEDFLKNGFSPSTVKALDNIHTITDAYPDSYVRDHLSAVQKNPDHVYSDTFLVIKELELHFQDLTPAVIEDAITFAKINHKTLNFYTSYSLTQPRYIRCWLDSEQRPLHYSSKEPYSNKVAQRAQKYLNDACREEEARIEKIKRARDPFYDLKPEDLLARANSSQSVKYCAETLHTILTKQYRRKQEYKDIAFKIGEALIPLLSTPLSSDEMNIPDKSNGIPLLISLYQKHQMYTEALNLCHAAQYADLSDNTLPTYGQRIKILTNKLSPSRVRQASRKGTLTEARKLDLVKKYIHSTSAERKQLAIEFGVTYSNMSYIVSKNKHLLPDEIKKPLTLKEKLAIVQEYINSNPEERKELATKHTLTSGALRQMVNSYRGRL